SPALAPPIAEKQPRSRPPHPARTPAQPPQLRAAPAASPSAPARRHLPSRRASTGRSPSTPPPGSASSQSPRLSRREVLTPASPALLQHAQPLDDHLLINRL